MTRRNLLQQTLALSASTAVTGLASALPQEANAHTLSTVMVPKTPPVRNVVVVGAGVFGLWTALTLLRTGLRVTLVDAFGVGNIRSSSSDETRALRAGYGATEVYVGMVARSIELWKAHEEKTKRE